IRDDLVTGVQTCALPIYRVSVDLTYYNKRTKDALIARIIPPSAGASDTRFENLGAVVNRGLEALVTARVVDRQQFGWDLGVNARSEERRVGKGGRSRGHE